MMPSLSRTVFLLCTLLVLAGCRTINERNAVFTGLSDEPIACAKWRKLVGVYSGPVRSMSKGVGTTGITTQNMRLEVYGSPENPLVFLRLRAFATSAFTAYGERIESFTNMPEREFGVRARLSVSSHAPHDLFVTLEPTILSPNRGGAMIFSFQENGRVDVDSVGHFQRRGIGTLNREPFANVRE